VSRLLAAKRRAKRGLDSGRASATLPLSGECQLASELQAQNESLDGLVLMGWSLHCGLLDGV
jgi:hypothetical protein